MKKIKTILILLIIFLIAVGLYFSFFNKKKLEMEKMNDIKNILEPYAHNFSQTQEGIILQFQNGKCYFEAYFKGKEVAKSIELKVFFKSQITEMKDPEAEKAEKFACYEGAINVLIVGLKDKNSKQEFIKLSRNLNTKLKESNEVKLPFVNKKVSGSYSEGDLIININ